MSWNSLTVVLMLYIYFYKQNLFDACSVGWTKKTLTHLSFEALFSRYSCFQLTLQKQNTSRFVLIYPTEYSFFLLFKQCSVTIKTMQAWSRQMVQRPSAASLSMKRRERPSRTRIKPLWWMVSSGPRLAVQTTTEQAQQSITGHMLHHQHKVTDVLNNQRV